MVKGQSLRTKRYMVVSSYYGWDSEIVSRV